MSLSDKTLGTILLAAAVVIFLYYTIWVMILVSLRNSFRLLDSLTHYLCECFVIICLSNWNYSRLHNPITQYSNIFHTKNTQSLCHAFF